MKRLLIALALLLPVLSIPADAVDNQPEYFPFVNISATTAAFTLKGGNYGMTVHATFGGGSVTLQRLATDGSTYVTCLTAFAADGYGSANLPNGSYKITVVTATAVYVDVSAVVTAN